MANQQNIVQEIEKIMSDLAKEENKINNQYTITPI